MEKYEIVNIEFNALMAAVEEFVDIRPNLTYNNYVSFEIVIFLGSKPVYETSMFVPNDSEPYTLVDSAKRVRVPLQIHNSVISFVE